MCNAWGGLKVNLVNAPMKFVPRSDRNFFTAPRIDMNRVRALINAKLLSSYMTSIWTALDVRQLKSTVHLFECASRRRVMCATMFHRPKTSTLTISNGTTLSAGRSAIIC